MTKDTQDMQSVINKCRENVSLLRVLLNGEQFVLMTVGYSSLFVAYILYVKTAESYKYACCYIVSLKVLP